MDDDVIEGVVLRVLDGDTFDLDVDSVAEDNEYEYNDVERIRIADKDAPELSEPGGEAAKTKLRSRLQGRRVRVRVKARDKYGRVVGKVRVVG